MPIITAPTSTSIIRPRLPRILRSRRCTHRRLRRTGRRLGATLATTRALLEVSAASTTGSGRNRRLRGVVVHAFPSGGTACAAAEAGLLLLAAGLLLFVFLLFEGKLVLGSVSGGGGGRGKLGVLTVAVAGVAGVGLHLVHLHHLLLLLHLLHLHWVHAAAGPAVGAHHLGVGRAVAAGHRGAHHLLLHGGHGHWIHAAHAAAGLLLDEVLLHGLEVLLHALPVLGHHGRAHTAVAALRALILLIIVAAAIVVVVTSIVTVVELVASTELLIVPTFVVAHVASGLGALNFDRLAENLKGAFECGIDCGISVEGHETKATGSTRLLVHHESGIDNTAELLEEIGEVFLGCLLTNTADEYLACALLLFTRNSALGIDLGW